MSDIAARIVLLVKCCYFRYS